MGDGVVSGDRLASKVAIVTGASSGLGDRFARVLAAQGATVIAAARRVERLEALAAEVPGVIAAPCDVGDDDALAALVASAVSAAGRVDIVVNNAGITDAVTKAEEQDPADFRRVIEINLNAVFVLSALAAKQMIAQGDGGRIVNIASIHGMVAASPVHQAAYVASKGAVVMLTKELAVQWAKHEITVNSIAPGYFASELTEEMFDAEGAPLDYITRRAALRRSGNVEELDETLLLLAGQGSSYITGQTIAVDGGWTAR